MKDLLSFFEIFKDRFRERPKGFMKLWPAPPDESRCQD